MTAHAALTSTRPLGLVVCAVLCASLCAVPAQAARPFDTEDAGTLDARACELELVSEQLRQPGEPAARAHTLQGACGIGAGTQWGLGVQRSSAAGVRERALALSGKTVLIQGALGQPGISLAYGGDWLQRATGAGWQLSGLGAALVASVPAGAWGTVHANLGWQQQRPGKINTRSWALALEKSVSEQWDAGVETYGDNRDPSWWGLGLRWTPTAGVSFNAAAARQTGSLRARSFSMGGKLEF